MNLANYVQLTLINSDGRPQVVANYARDIFAQKVIGWLSQQAGGEVTVANATNLSLAQFDD